MGWDCRTWMARVRWLTRAGGVVQNSSLWRPYHWRKQCIAEGLPELPEVLPVLRAFAMMDRHEDAHLR